MTVENHYENFKNRYKKEIIATSLVVLFFGGYYVGAKAFGLIDRNDAEASYYSIENKNTPLLTKLASSNSIYMSNKYIKRVRVFDEYKESLQDFLTNSTMSIREPKHFKVLYQGFSNSGVKFYTDLDVLKLEDFNSSAYYKISETVKPDFFNLIEKMLYLSSTTIKDCENWKSVNIVDLNSNVSKKIKESDFDEFASKISIVRSCGKIQPEKNLNLVKNNYTVQITTKNDITYTLYTMGKNYMKIELNGSNSEYFEVKTSGYDYIVNLMHP